MLASYSRGFWLMCLSSFLFFASFNLLLPELPDHLTRLGGGEYKGYILALFTLTAGLSRPFSGRFSDTVGRIPVMVAGSLVCFLCGFAYPWALTVSSFLGLRLLHGFSTGFKPTGTAAYLADIVPLEKRGEAMGLFGLMSSVGMAAGPAFGSWLTQHFSLNTMFYCSSALALLSVLVQGTLTETLPVAQRQPFRWGLLKLRLDELLEPRVAAPSLVMLLCVVPFGVLFTVAPDQGRALGLVGSTKGLFYGCYTAATLGVRLVAGHSSDRYGRVPVLRASAAVMALGLLVLVWSPSAPVFLAGTLLYGLGAGLNSPTLYAWTIDLSYPQHRGRAVATMYIALEAGIGLGALLAGWLFGNHLARLPWVHALSLGAVLLALAYLLLGVRATPAHPPAAAALAAQVLAPGAPDELA